MSDTQSQPRKALGRATAAARADIAAYVKERDEALAALDLEWARKRQPGISDAVALMAMHKARYEAVNIASDLRQESRRWLEARMYGRLGGLPWPKRDELPA
jgi:hypothetical protein